MKNIIYLLSITILYSCGGSDGGSGSGSDSMFNSHQETLNAFNEIMIDENIVSKNKNSVEYSFKSEEGDYFKSINISVKSEEKGEYERLFDKNIQGRFKIGTHETGGIYECFIYFYLPKGKSLTTENILKYNELDFDEDFIRLNYSWESNSSLSDKKSLLKTGVNIIHNNGVTSKDNKYFTGGGYYFKTYVQDTIEYSKMVNGLKEGKYFKKNIVINKKRKNGKKGPTLFDGSLVKYIEEEGNYINNIKTGEWIERDMGIVKSKTIYENGRTISKITYGKVSLSGPDSLFKVVGGKFLWSNQDKFKIDEDSKGYKSYTPIVTQIENFKEFEGQYGRISSERHGKYEENRFTNYVFGSAARLIPQIRANYNQGSLDGNVIQYHYNNGKEEKNLEYKNGHLIKGVVNVYYDDYLQKTTIISEDGTYNFKTYDSNGVITDEGIVKTFTVKTGLSNKPL